MKFGLIEVMAAALRGIRLRPDAGAANYVELRSPATLSGNVILTMPASLPASGTEIVTISNTGQLGRTPASGGGSVTSVAIATPADLSVAGSPITTSGTITLARTSQTANTFLGAPNGANGAPSYRALAALDIPTLLAARISDFDTQVRVSRLDQMAAPTATLSLNSQRIIGLLDPTGSQDAATKQYVDAIAAGDGNKGTARVASTANVTIASPGGVIDGVTLSAGELVLLKDQTTGSQNGLYVWNGAAVAMTRATNADTSAEVRSGMFVFVTEGTANSDNGFTLTTNDPITLGTTALVFTQTSGAGQVLAGTGLTKTGNSIDVIGTTNRIAVAADSIDISPSYVGQATITTVGTIGTGVWNGTPIPVSNGGTGSATPAAARAALVAAGVFRQSFTNASLTAGILTVTHNLGSLIVNVQVYDEVNKMIHPDDITLTTSSALTVDLTSFGNIPSTFNCVVTG